MNQGADCKPPIYGDEPLYSEPREYMTQLLTLVDGSGKVEAKFWDTRVHKLVEWILPRLRADSSLGDDGAKYYCDIVETMLFDYDRRQDRKSLTETELDGYYRKMLDGSIDVTLFAIDAMTRSGDLRDFGLAQGKLYTVRDLLNDWRLGIINIPVDVLNEAGVDSKATINEVQKSKRIGEWRDDQQSDATKLMQENIELIKGLGDTAAKIMLRGLANGAIGGVLRKEEFDRRSLT